jgi:hypothetical protein
VASRAGGRWCLFPSLTHTRGAPTLPAPSWVPRHSPTSSIGGFSRTMSGFFGERRGGTAGWQPVPGVSTFSEPQTSLARCGHRSQRMESSLPMPSLPSCSNLTRRQLSTPSLAFRWLGDFTAM